MEASLSLCVSVLILDSFSRKWTTRPIVQIRLDTVSTPTHPPTIILSMLDSDLSMLVQCLHPWAEVGNLHPTVLPDQMNVLRSLEAIRRPTLKMPKACNIRDPVQWLEER